MALAVMLRMLNPPRKFYISADKIDRIWRVAKIVPASAGALYPPTVTGYRPEARA